ncbi:MAG: Holliday junction resolvase RuvX [Bacillota bacterium]|nr:Holliday junction resolvase RuvX [Bacillota bacterium]
MRIMGLDLGKRRIGVAVSDELGITAQALRTIERGRFQDDLEAIRALVQGYQVEEIVIGLPRHMTGRVGKEGEEIVAFGKELEKYLSVPVVFWDERLSTVAAEKSLIAGALTRSRRRKIIDQVAASWILGGYLTWRRKRPDTTEEDF